MANYVIPETAKDWKNSKVASKTLTAYAQGEWLTNDGTNTIPATTTTKRLDGICQDAKLVTDSAVTPVNCLVPRSPNAGVIMDVGTGAIAKDDEGQAFDLATSTTINASSSTYSPLKLVKFLTTTKGVFVPNYEIGVNA